MAPIHITFDAEAQALLESVERRRNDLSTFQIPRLRACTGPLATQQAWAAEIREDIEQLAKQVEELDVLIDDQRTDRARTALKAKVDEHLKMLDGLRKDSRAAVLASKRAIDAQTRSQREELLLRSPSVREQVTPSNEKVTEDVLIKANNNVTDALQRTIGLMQKELEQSVLSSQLLESSTANLQSASQEHDMLNLLIGTSKQLVTALEQTDWLDRVLIIAALVFFGLVVLFILKQRILDRGLRIAFWWTRFVPGLDGSRGRATGEKLKEVVTDVGAGTSLTSVVVAATAIPSTLASVLAVTATLPGHSIDVSQTEESVPLWGVASESAATADSGSTLVSEPVHVEL
ncbi:Sec20-domain-containing protein [Boletus edulis BED1]|uniref:Sec20-domain-containing protein n=1 Tax=Boletus edulis BED1 TaxID=1328754 RepID=A0AAD4GDZ4_BOLED|nr:Sec20-domain-containing protein [Boletus edulis BED1]